MEENYDYDSADVITIGTIGPAGERTFHLQAVKDERILTLTFEKQQAAALAESIDALLDEIKERYELDIPEVDSTDVDLDLAEPIIPAFRVAQLGLGYDNDEDLIVLVVNELQPESMDTEPRVARMSGTREQMKMLAEHAREVISKGRPDPSSNGHKMHY